MCIECAMNMEMKWIWMELYIDMVFVLIIFIQSYLCTHCLRQINSDISTFEQLISNKGLSFELFFQNQICKFVYKESLLYNIIVYSVTFLTEGLILVYTWKIRQFDYYNTQQKQYSNL